MTVPNLAERRVLVTGGSGFIGRHLTRRLIDAGARVFATSRHPPPSETDDVQRLHLDLSETQSIRASVDVARPELVFHLAARLGADRSVAFAERALQENVLGTHTLLSALLESGPPVRVVFAGSSEEYGRGATLPLTEEQMLRPVSPYSISKAAASQLALAYGDLYPLAVTVVRPFIVYGPGQSPSMMLPSLIETLLSGGEFAMTAGEQTRDFIYVEDVIEGLIAAASDEAAGEVFNVCSGVERSIRDAAELASETIGGSGRVVIGALPYRENEVWRLVGSNEKARRILHWKPRTTLEEGLRKTVEWSRQHHASRA